MRHVVQLSTTIGAKPGCGPYPATTVATSVFETLATYAADVLSHGDLSTTLRTWKRLLQLILRFPYLNVTAQSKPHANASKTNYIPGGSKVENSLYFHHLRIPFLYIYKGGCYKVGTCSTYVCIVRGT